MTAGTDTFVEQIVRRRPGDERLFKAGCILAGLVISALALWKLGVFAVLVIAAVAAAEYFCFIYAVKEYEYSLLGGELTVEMIRGRRKRKRMFSCACREISVMAPAGREGGDVKAGCARSYDFSASAADEDRWYFIAERQTGERTLVYLSPDRRLLGAFKTHLGRKMEDK